MEKKDDEKKNTPNSEADKDPEEMDFDEMKKILYDEILRRDKVIDKLKKENEILLKTALKNAERRADDKK